MLLMGAGGDRARAAEADPASELAAAAADALSQPPQDRLALRYLSLYAVEPDRRDEVAAAASYLLNALGRGRAIELPSRVEGERGTLLRIDLRRYAPTADDAREWAAAWEQIAIADPYWHLRTEVLAASPSGASVMTAGSRAAMRTAAPRQPRAILKRQTVTVDGGWVGLENAVQLRALTGSVGALLRADQFVAVASVPPRYYDFAGVEKTEAAFLRSLGIDPGRIERLRANAGANLIVSGVTRKPRRVVWQQGPFGGAYSTLDTLQVDAARDPFRRPVSVGGLEMEFDASEWFALRGNGLWITALFDRAGKRQESVPDRIAKDDSDPHGPGIVEPLLSCIRCHVEGGLRPFRDDQTRLLAEGIELRGFDRSVVRRAAEFYDEPRLQRQMAFDRETYSQAVQRATAGMRPPDLADALARTVREFAYLPVTPAQAARELGLAPDQLSPALSTSRDPIVLLVARGGEVLRGQWESSFAEGAVLAERYRASLLAPPAR